MVPDDVINNNIIYHFSFDSLPTTCTYAFSVDRRGTSHSRHEGFFYIIITLLHETMILVRLIVRGEFNPKLIHRLKYTRGDCV